MSFEIKSPCRTCPQVGGTKEICAKYCPEMQQFKEGLNEYARETLACFEKEADMGGLPLFVEGRLHQTMDIQEDVMIKDMDG